MKVRESTAIQESRNEATKRFDMPEIITYRHEDSIVRENNKTQWNTQTPYRNGNVIACRPDLLRVPFHGARGPGRLVRVFPPPKVWEGGPEKPLYPDDQYRDDGHTFGDPVGAERFSNDDVPVHGNHSVGIKVRESHQIQPESLKHANPVPPEVVTIEVGYHRNKCDTTHSNIPQ